METIQQSPITLKLIFQQNWNALLAPSIRVKYVMFLIPAKADFVQSVPKFKSISGWQT
jgi:hypothetical protein